MSDAALPFVDSVLHLTDFSEAGEAAFAHALAVALLRKADLTLLHAGQGNLGDDEWRRFPAVRPSLERWGLLEEGSPRSAVYQELGLRIQKVDARAPTLLSGILGFVERHPVDLLVVATEGRQGLPAFLRPSVAERIARRSRTRTLFVPKQGRGFVDPEDGHLTLRRILVPMDTQPIPEAAITYASRAASLLGDPPVAITLLHVGSEAPDPELPEGEDFHFEHEEREGRVVDEILACAREREVDLIAMTTAGHDGVLDALRGSVTEQVLRGAECPVLAIPAD